MAVALQQVPYSSSHYRSLQLCPGSMDQTNNTRPSLPSISSLIDAVKDQAEAVKEASPKAESVRRISSGSQGQPATSPDRPSLVGSPRSHPPPTPELPPASSFDFRRPADGNGSPTSAATRTSYYPQTSSSTDPELYAQRSSNYPPVPEANSSYPPIPDMSHWPQPPPPPPPPSAQQQTQSPTQTGPSEVPQAQPPLKSEFSVEGSHYPGLTQQRPLPGNFPPPLSGQALSPIDPQMAPTWQQQHHHYYPPANPPSYPQIQERYICPTCSKPFSRPSSLKIHTYSHTGEKPYKCKHEGCGKHFSVRSNMKRHEKGCHGGESASASESSPKTT